ncbi:NAD(P)H-binding protein [Streptomyces avicenniae]|uniref:NAD(P)H-binding protein n=1 Tax=Streptomyces avicenniae TaxID=500153 RepID=UPI00069B1B01|nr:NAD(P)H-binding protein [Streptomyces avicenniae]
MIIVSAASGALGGLVIDRLLTRLPAAEVVAAVRDPSGAPQLAARGVTLRRGDYDDADSLRTAFAGADRLLLISSPELDPERRTRHHLTAVDAARAAGVGSVVYTSFLGSDAPRPGVPDAHHATEQALHDSGLPRTVLRHPFYSEAYLDAPLLRAAVAAGELIDGTGGRGLNTALRADLAEAAAVVLTEEGHLGRAYDFTGEPWTLPELALTLSRVSGTPVARVERDEPAPGPRGWLDGLVRSGALERRTGDLRAVLGRPATGLEEAVTRALGAAS